jgi:hypothetical protein
MKKVFWCAALTIVLGQFASASPFLDLTSGAVNVPVAGTGSFVLYSNADLNGWDVIDLGTSSSPSLSPFGINNIAVAVCASGVCLSDPLDIYLTDTGFTQPVGALGFTADYTAIQFSSGSTSQTAWFDPANGPFAQTTLIGTVGPFAGVSISTPVENSGSATGGGTAGPSPYSLTIEEVFNANGSPGVFVADPATLSAAVPEPATISLLGGVLLVLGRRWRKRLG